MNMKLFLLEQLVYACVFIYVRMSGRVYVFACMQVCPIVCMLVYLLHLSQLEYVYRLRSCVGLTFSVPGCRRQVFTFVLYYCI